MVQLILNSQKNEYINFSVVSDDSGLSERFILPKTFSQAMNKRGQLGWIEFKYFLGGLAIGLILALLLVFLGTAEVLPFKIPLVCG